MRRIDRNRKVELTLQVQTFVEPDGRIETTVYSHNGERDLTPRHTVLGSLAKSNGWWCVFDRAGNMTTSKATKDKAITEFERQAMVTVAGWAIR